MFVILRHCIEDNIEIVMDVIETKSDLDLYVAAMHAMNPLLKKVQNIPTNPRIAYTIPFAETDVYEFSFQYFECVREPSWKFY
jgi:hypothetical protein